MTELVIARCSDRSALRIVWCVHVISLSDCSRYLPLLGLHAYTELGIEKMSTPGWYGGIDILEVTATEHALFGGGGKDLLLGAGSDDLLSGGNGDDWLLGRDGIDHLIGGKGNDIMSGGDGVDTFVFGAKSGKDVIVDFDGANDILQIARTKTIKNIADVIKHAKTHGDDLVITLGKGQTITLKDVTKAELKANAEDHVKIV